MNSVCNIYFSGSLLTNSNCSALEDERKNNEGTTEGTASPLPSTETNIADRVVDDKMIGDGLEAFGTAESSSLSNPSKDLRESGAPETEKPSEWVEWRESSDSFTPTDANLNSSKSCTATVNSAESSNAAADIDPPNSISGSAEQNDAVTESIAQSTPSVLPNDKLKVEQESRDDDSSANKTNVSPSSTDQSIGVVKSNIEGLPEAENPDVSSSSLSNVDKPSCHSAGDETSSSTSNVDKDKPAAAESSTTGGAEHKMES